MPHVLAARTSENPNSDQVQEFLLTSFPNVEYLNTDIKTLQVLTGSPNNHVGHRGRPIFPKLRCVRVDSLANADGARSAVRDACIESVCTQFFEERARVGYPVRTFDLSKCDEIVPLAALDGVVGLRVMWTSDSGDMDEYRYGDGEAERLVHETWSTEASGGLPEST
ncbi:unnamed protein product [Cyclocybe aegerita]|uniref:Uncharacterized protein n=1 Tax=Cyclocybe aegerita TaxID=1973307 RepID=A0A8S0WG83_CYCAE|nr:unnamed protein product [Cyclocybe aegerita]